MRMLDKLVHGPAVGDERRHAHVEGLRGKGGHLSCVGDACTLWPTPYSSPLLLRLPRGGVSQYLSGWSGWQGLLGRCQHHHSCYAQRPVGLVTTISSLRSHCRSDQTHDSPVGTCLPHAKHLSNMSQEDRRPPSSPLEAPQTTTSHI